MAYTKDSIPPGHTEFGGGPGLIDPENRKDRNLTNEERLMELYATTTYPPGVAHGVTDEERAARAAEIELENNPETAPVGRVRP